MNVELQSLPSPGTTAQRSVRESLSPASADPGFARGMTQQPPRRRRTRDLSLKVTGLQPLPMELPGWERRLVEPLLAQLLDESKPKEVDDAPAQ